MPHVHNGLHEYTRLLDAAARAIGEKSGSQDFTGIERFGETLTPVMDLWALPEWALLRGEVLFARQVSTGPGALTFSSFELVNPTGSDVLAVVLFIRNIQAAIETNIDNGGALGVVATSRGVAIDSRFQIGDVSACTLVAGQLAGAAALPQELLGTGITSSYPYILRPGRKLMCIAPVVNTTLQMNWLWSERPLLPTEERA